MWIQGPQHTGAFGARDAWQAGRLTPNTFERQPGKSRGLDLQWRQAVRTAADHLQAMEPRLYPLHQMPVQGATATDDQALHIGRMAAHVGCADLCCECRQSGLNVGRCDIGKTLQSRLQPCGVEQVAASALGGMSNR